MATPFYLRMPATLTRAGLAALALAAGAACRADVDINPTVTNWVQPLFTKEGFHKLTLRGAQMTPKTRDEIHVLDINITVFSGTAAAKVDSIILSPNATFLVTERFAKGPDLVRLIRDDLDVTGNDWTYDANSEKISIAHNTRVVIHEALPDLLK